MHLVMTRHSNIVISAHAEDRFVNIHQDTVDADITYTVKL